MSWWIYLDGAKPLDEPFQEGGSQPVGGTTDCELNVTYNYGRLFDFKILHGQVAAASIPALRHFRDQHPDAAPSADYWAPTPGNVKAAIERLLSFAERNPNCVWRVH